MRNGRLAAFGPSLGAADGRLGEPVLAPVVREIQRTRAGRPAIVGDYVSIPANSEGHVDLKISTAAPMFVEYLVFTLDDKPIWALATCPIDIRAIKLQREDVQSEEEIVTGQFNLMCAINGNGVCLAQYLAKADIIHQGSVMTVTMVNRDLGLAHRVDVAAHGFLVPRNQLADYLG